MNRLEKRSFYSFVATYIASSLLFVLLVGFWYYQAQAASLKSSEYYKLQHIADKISGKIILAHMSGVELDLSVDQSANLALYNSRLECIYGELKSGVSVKKGGYFEQNGYNIIVSDSPQHHLGVYLVAVESDNLANKVSRLQGVVILTMAGAFLFICIIAWFLSRLFMRPIQERVKQIERFINDITHELNTPVAALSMLSSQALKNGKYTEKSLKNIAISTRQLYDIYRSLTYINFKQELLSDTKVDLQEVVLKSCEYYDFYLQSKQIKLKIDTEPLEYTIDRDRALHLFNNLISNAIKYSPPQTQIEITLKDNYFYIKDEGIGIDKKDQQKIYERFYRNTEYAGGFGIGLSVVRDICNRYDILIEIESSKNSGTMFLLKFNF